MTLYICFGKWAKPRIEVNNDLCLFRVCLGYVAFSIVKFDVEHLFEVLTEKGE